MKEETKKEETKKEETKKEETKKVLLDELDLEVNEIYCSLEWILEMISSSNILFSKTVEIIRLKNHAEEKYLSALKTIDLLKEGNN